LLGKKWRRPLRAACSASGSTISSCSASVLHRQGQRFGDEGGVRVGRASAARAAASMKLAGQAAFAGGEAAVASRISRARQALAGFPAIERVAVVRQQVGQFLRRVGKSSTTGAEKSRSSEGTGAASMSSKANSCAVGLSVSTRRAGRCVSSHAER
jgi:hypothetical protein